MTVEMQSFGESTLGAFIQSTLDARDDETTLAPHIWGGGQGTGLFGVAFVREYATDFSTVRQSDIHDSFGVGVGGTSGAGGTFDTLFAARTNAFDELTIEWDGSTTYATILRSFGGQRSGIGGDRETVYTGLYQASGALPNLIEVRDYETMSVDYTAGTADFGPSQYTSGCGGDSSVMISCAWHVADAADHWYTTLPGSVWDVLETVASPDVVAPPNTWITLGAGGSWANAYFCQGKFNSSTAARCYHCVTEDLSVITGPVDVEVFNEIGRGIGGD